MPEGMFKVFHISHWGSLFWNGSKLCRCSFFLSIVEPLPIRTSGRLCLSKLLFFILSHVTDLLPINLLSSNMFLQLSLSHHLRLDFVAPCQFLTCCCHQINSRWADSFHEIVKCLTLNNLKVFYVLWSMKCWWDFFFFTFLYSIHTLLGLHIFSLQTAYVFKFPVFKTNSFIAALFFSFEEKVKQTFVWCFSSQGRSRPLIRMEMAPSDSASWRYEAMTWTNQILLYKLINIKQKTYLYQTGQLLLLSTHFSVQKCLRNLKSSQQRISTNLNA